MRCFIALDISKEVRQSIGSAIEKVKGLSRSVRWVTPGNVHLTLKFLGEVGDPLVFRIQERLLQLCAAHETFELTVRGTGAFPDPGHPNILWVGINESPPLGLLQSNIEKSLAELGFEREKKRFSPHLTVGRVKGRDDLGAVIREWVSLKDVFFGTITVGETLLVKSTLKPGGAEYSKIAGFKLGGGSNEQG